jgi:hypothetical protein
MTLITTSCEPAPCLVSFLTYPYPVLHGATAEEVGLPAAHSCEPAGAVAAVSRGDRMRRAGRAPCGPSPCGPCSVRAVAVRAVLRAGRAPCGPCSMWAVRRVGRAPCRSCTVRAGSALLQDARLPGRRGRCGRRTRRCGLVGAAVRSLRARGAFGCGNGYRCVRLTAPVTGCPLYVVIASGHNG